MRMPRATAWLTAVRKAADKLPQQRAISMGAVTPAERRALAAQLYTAGAPPPNPEKPNPLHAVVTLQPRSQAERQIRVALRNAELLELRQRLMEETRATLKCMNRHWPGGLPDAPAGPNSSKAALPAWTDAEWIRMGKRLDGLWLAQAAPALTPGGWLTPPDALPILENAARLAPDSPTVRLLLAEAQLQNGLPQQCVESCNEALRLDPALGRARYIRGLAHWRLQQLALAEDDLSRALAAPSKPSAQGIERARLLRPAEPCACYAATIRACARTLQRPAPGPTVKGWPWRARKTYCRAGATTEDPASTSRPPAVLPPAFQISPRASPAACGTGARLMSRPPLLKVYGHIYPVSEAFFSDLTRACADALADDANEPVLAREGDLARFSLEGAYFPVEEVLAAVTRHLRPEHKGKLDVLDPGKTGGLSATFSHREKYTSAPRR